MTLKLAEFVRKPFVVKAVKVNAENINEVAKWCNGKVEDDEGKPFIKVEVQRPLDERQTRAYFGDFVLAAGRSFKVYTEFAFNKSFVPNAPTTKKPGRPKTPVVRTPETEGISPAVQPVQPAYPEQLVLNISDHGLSGEPAEMREARVTVTPSYQLNP